MKRAILLSVAALASVSLAARSHAQTPASPAPAAGFSALRGVLVDSLHDGPLVHANVTVEGTSRAAFTDENGAYRIDSIPPGGHRVMITHPVLDTIGITLRTPAYNFVAGTTHQLDFPIPGPAVITSRLCSAAQMARGPGALIGFVRDPDTHQPSAGAQVQLVYDELDLIGRKQPRVRSINVDSAGFYAICGLPKDMSGKVQVFHNGVSSGEVPAEITNGFLGLRAFSIVAQHQQIVEVKGDSGKVRRVAKGSAKVTGRVVDKLGKPLREARVTIQGGGDTPVLTNANGQFTLDSLPSGTQSLEVRKLGYAATEVPVELASARPATANVTMGDAVPVLETMRVEAAEDKGLSALGYTQRKQMGMGHYLDGNQINHNSLVFSDVMRNIPGLTIKPNGDGRTFTITDSRSPANGCVVYYVDGNPWTSMTPGDIDDFVLPSEMVAVEVYHGSTTPAQFQKPGQTSCATIVVWTAGKVNTVAGHQKKKP